MLIETTQSFGTKEDAEDNLAGIKGLPGFVFGYVRAPYQPGGQYDLVHVFNCTGSYTQNLRKQRAIESLTTNELSTLAIYR